jgi:alpha/beta superfamily hydrolase
VSAAASLPEVRDVSFLSGIHRIDARFHPPLGALRGAAVIAHPHPAHGGHMDHAVVVAASERCAAHGLATLRFDFRGVRQSEGSREEIEGHLDDWRAAALDATRRAEGHPFLLGGGFSYGARTLAGLLNPLAERRPAVDAALLLGPATRVPRTRRDFGNLLLGRPLSDAAIDPEVLGRLRALPVPTEVIVGSVDVVAPYEELRANLPTGATMQVLQGLNHFFSRRPGAGPLERDVFVQAVDQALGRLLPVADPARD